LLTRPLPVKPKFADDQGNIRAEFCDLLSHGPVQPARDVCGQPPPTPRLPRPPVVSRELRDEVKTCPSGGGASPGPAVRPPGRSRRTPPRSERCSIWPTRSRRWRSQPRTVAAGTPSSAPRRAVPLPCRTDAADVRAITPTGSARLGADHAGSRMCVAPHERHRPRRGRSRRRSPPSAG
jgi:hypothetical protein